VLKVGFKTIFAPV